MISQKPMSAYFSFVVPLLISILISAGTVGPLYFFGNSLKKVNKDGVVKIVAEYSPHPTSQKASTSFFLLIETHSDEFEFYNVQKLSFLRVDGGPLQPAVRWVPSGKGHHLNGTVTFAQDLPDGTRNLQLVIKNIEGVPERTLEWQIDVRS